MKVKQHASSLLISKIIGKFGNFRENFIFANSVKMQICDPQSSRLRHDLHVSVHEGVYFARVLFSQNIAYAKFRENKTLAKISEYTVIGKLGWIPRTTTQKHWAVLRSR